MPGRKKQGFPIKYKGRQRERQLANIHLDTGRHHQIRVQMSGMGCPILGDVKYGGEEKARGQIALCASSLTFVHPKTKKADAV